jgi:hypothetical protein
LFDENRLITKRDAAASRWEAVQLQAANAQRELDYAIAVVEQHKDTLSTEELQSTMAKIDEQKNEIKSYLLKGHQVFVESQRAYESGMSKVQRA